MPKQRIFLSPPHMGGTEQDYVREAFESNYVAPLGPQVNAFETRFSSVVDCPHCLALTSATAGLHLGLRLLGVGPGDLVVSSTLTFIGGVCPINYLGAEPVFVDADPASWNLDPLLLDEALGSLVSQGRPAAAVVVTDLYGQCADYDAISAVCDLHDVPLAVDSAEALGARYKGRPAGAAGRFAVYSFNGNKIITSSGGGMLCSDDQGFIEEARRLSQQARDPFPHYEHSTWGYNYRMSNIVAAIGLGQLDVLDERVRRRREIFDWYVARFADVDGISFMPEAGYGESNRWLSVVLLDAEVFGATPRQVMAAFEADNIEARPVWKPMHLQPVYAGCMAFGGAVSEDLFARGLCLPSGTAMTENDLERIAEVVCDCRS